jgi:uncharacterized protein YjiS (DUF1127 family)
MEAAMFSFQNPTSRSAITARVAEWRRRTRSRFEPTSFRDHEFGDLPYDRAEIRAETAKWFWQP